MNVFFLAVTLSGLCTIAQHDEEYWAVLPNTSNPSDCNQAMVPHEPILSFPLSYLKYDDQICATSKSQIRTWANALYNGGDPFSCRFVDGVCQLLDPSNTPPEAYSPLKKISCKNGTVQGTCVMEDKGCTYSAGTCSSTEYLCARPNIRCEEIDVLGAGSKQCVYQNGNRIARDSEGAQVVNSPISIGDLRVTFPNSDTSQAPNPVALTLAKRSDLFSSGANEATFDKSLLSGPFNTTRLSARLKLHQGTLMSKRRSRNPDLTEKDWCFDKINAQKCKTENNPVKRKLDEAAEWKIRISDPENNGVSISSTNGSWNLHPGRSGTTLFVGISNLPVETPANGESVNILHHFGWSYKTSKSHPSSPCPLPHSANGILTHSAAGGGVFCPIDLAGGG